MSMNNFFEIHKKEKEDKSIIYEIGLNREHKIYEGHFPDKAIVPGVLSMQIIKELLEDDLEVELRLQKAGNVKFLYPILPEINKNLNISIRYVSKISETLKVKACIYSKDIQFMKLQATYIRSCGYFK